MASSEPLRLGEWEHGRSTKPAGFGDDQAARDLAARLTESRLLTIRELRDSIEVESNSRVGHARIGDLDVVIEPKLMRGTLGAIVSYAYRTTSLAVLPEASIAVGDDAVLELLISAYLIEVRHLITAGLVRDYVAVQEDLAAPRGRIEFSRLARRGGVVAAQLPCRHFLHTADNPWNRALAAGVEHCLRHAHDPRNTGTASLLRQELREVAGGTQIDNAALSSLLAGGNRRFARYAPAVHLLQLIVASQGALLLDLGRTISLPGFLFDMNLLWQHVLERLLVENAPSGSTVALQHSLHDLFHYESARRRDPVPRPDFAWLVGGQCVGLLDAKYRDLSVLPLGRDMLYQLAVYGLSQAAGATVVALYPTDNPAARDETITVNDAVSGGRRARITLRPVHVTRLAGVVARKGGEGVQMRRELAAELLSGAF